MFSKKIKWSIITLLLVVLTSCTNATKEAENYYNEVYKDAIEESQKIEHSLKDFFNAVNASDPEDAIALLNDRVIPEHDSLAGILNQADLKQDDLTDLNNLAIDITTYSEETFVLLHTILAEIIDKKDDVEDIHLDTQLKNLDNLNVKFAEKRRAYQDQLKEISAEYDSFTGEESELLTYDALDIEEANEQYEELVIAFMESVTGSNHQAASTGTSSDEELSEQGNQEVTFNGEVTIDQTFVVEGQSNLPEGAYLQIRTYQYGTENPYIRGEAEVDDSGKFHFEMDVEEDELSGKPIEVQVQFIPHKTKNKEFQDIYGVEGEKIDGPFKHKITDAKRTRTAAIAYAYIEFDAGEKGSFERNEWDAPSDYGDLNVWMEEEHIDTKGDYYDITMNSNLAELTGIKASIEIPGYEVAGYRSSTTVMPDGSFRFQIPRPDVDDAEINIIITSRISRSIETEELYGEKGEHLEGNLVEKTKKEHKISYEFTVE